MTETIPSRIRHIAHQYPDVAAQMYRTDDGDIRTVTYSELLRKIATVAAGFATLGVTRVERVGLIADNRPEWIVCDLALLSLGCADVPRGTDTSDQELHHILSIAECPSVVVENAEQLRRVTSMTDELPMLKRVFVIDATRAEVDEATPSIHFAVHLLKDVEHQGGMQGSDQLEALSSEIDRVRPADIATIIFTSGTTGVPKGVMISHENLLHQIRGIPERIHTKPGHVCLSVLPIWHAFERIMEYIILGLACTIVYSKPVGPVMLADFETFQPHWMAAVPRVWSAIKDGIVRKFAMMGGLPAAMFSAGLAVASTHERLRAYSRARLPHWSTAAGRFRRVFAIARAAVLSTILAPVRAVFDLLVFRKIRGRLGGRFLAGFSAGGSLSREVSAFYDAMGVGLLNAYGMSEASPLLTLQDPAKSAPGTVGSPIAGTEIRIVDDEGKRVPNGEKGLIYARGPQVMQGYLKQVQETAAAIDSDGWLNTGDLGTLTDRGELMITGRAKDTIVLLSGENIEPAPIEQALQASDLIQHAVVVGQDCKYLGVLIVADREHADALDDADELQSMIEREVRKRVSSDTGFRKMERIARIAIVDGPFEVGRELSQKLEVKRHEISRIYENEIEELFR